MFKQVDRTFAGRNGVNPLDHLALVVHMAKLCGANSPIQDSEQYANGCIGLLEAIQRFDPSRGTKFSTYACYWIKMRMLRKRSGDMKSAAKNYGVEPLLMSVINDNGELYIPDKVPEPIQNCINNEEVNGVNATVSRWLSYLPKRDREIVRMNIMEEKTLLETGKVFGITRERVRQIVVRSLEKIKELAAQSGGNSEIV